MLKLSHFNQVLVSSLLFHTVSLVLLSPLPPLPYFLPSCPHLSLFIHSCPSQFPTFFCCSSLAVLSNIFPPPFPYFGLAHPTLWPHYSSLNRSFYSFHHLSLLYVILISPPSHTSYCSYLPVFTTYCKPFLSPSIWPFRPHSSLIALSIIPSVHPHQSHPFPSLSSCSFLTPSQCLRLLTLSQRDRREGSV